MQTLLNHNNVTDKRNGTDAMNSTQASAIFKNAIAGSAKPAASAASRVKARKQLLAAQVAVLRQAIETIRSKARETPAWAHGYNSAVTAIELQIADLERTA